MKTTLKPTWRDASGTYLIGFLSEKIGVQDLERIYGEPQQRIDSNDDIAYCWLLEPREENLERRVITIYLFKSSLKNRNWSFHIGSQFESSINFLKADLGKEMAMSKEEFYNSPFQQELGRKAQAIINSLS